MDVSQDSSSFYLKFQTMRDFACHMAMKAGAKTKLHIIRRNPLNKECDFKSCILTILF